MLPPVLHYWSENSSIHFIIAGRNHFHNQCDTRSDPPRTNRDIRRCISSYFRALDKRIYPAHSTLFFSPRKKNLKKEKACPSLTPTISSEEGPGAINFRSGSERAALFPTSSTPIKLEVDPDLATDSAETGLTSRGSLPNTIRLGSLEQAFYLRRIDSQ